MLSSKLAFSKRYLLCCSGLEEETLRLYMCVAKKINRPELSSLVVSLGYDSMKHSKTIKELLKTIEKPEVKIENCEKTLSELWKEIKGFSEEILKMDQISDEEFCQVFKTLAELEDCLSDSYNALLKMKIHQTLANELNKLTPVNPENLMKIFESIIDDKQKHREVLMEIGYYFATKESEKAKVDAPVVKYQNPDAWSKPPVF